MNIQIEDDDNGLFGLYVILFDKMFSIECLTSDDDDNDDVLGFVSTDNIELLSSSHSSIPSDDGGFG